MVYYHVVSHVLQLAFTTNQWIAICAIVVPAIVAFTIYYLSYRRKKTRSVTYVFTKVTQRYGVVLSDYTQVKTENEKLKKQLAKSVQRIRELEGEKVKQDSAKALKSLKRKGDVTLLLALLVTLRDEHGSVHAMEDWVERNREISAIAELKRDTTIGLQANTEILRACPEDVAALRAIGDIHWYHGEYKKAEEHFKRIVRYGEKTSDDESKAWGWGPLSRLYQEQGEFVKAEELALKSLAIFKHLNIRIGEIGSSNVLAEIHIYRGEYDTAERLARGLYKLNDELPTKEKSSIPYTLLGQVCAQKGVLDKAEQMLRKALRHDIRHNDITRASHNYSHLGCFFLSKKGDLDTAEEMFLDALKLAENCGWVPQIAYICGKLTEIYSRQGITTQTRIYKDKVKSLYKKQSENSTAKK